MSYQIPIMYKLWALLCVVIVLTLRAKLIDWPLPGALLFSVAMWLISQRLKQPEKTLVLTASWAELITCTRQNQGRWQVKLWHIPRTGLFGKYHYLQSDYKLSCYWLQAHLKHLHILSSQHRAWHSEAAQKWAATWRSVLRETKLKGNNFKSHFLSNLGLPVEERFRFAVCRIIWNWLALHGKL